MKKYKYLLYATSLSALVSSYALADSEEDDTLPSKQMRTITPSESPIVSHGVDAYVFADFIYWTSRVDGIERLTSSSSSGYDRETINDGSSFELSKTDQISSSTDADHKLSPGFKVGAGLNFDYDGWDTLVNYTWLHNKAHSTTTYGSNKIISDTFSIDLTNILVFASRDITADRSHNNWYLHFNAIDWQLGRNFYISQKLLLRPFGALKGSWQKQYLQTKDTYITLGTVLTDKTQDNAKTIYNSHHDQHFWGVGVMAGLNSCWKITNDFSIFVNTAVSNLWGQFKNTKKSSLSYNEDSTIKIDAVYQELSKEYQSLHTISPVLELLMGLRYDYKFSNDDYRIRLEAGWEEQVWLNHNQFNKKFGNLNLQGFTLQARLDF